VIYRLSTAYLSRLESERNSKLFYGYAIASAICALAIWQFGLPAALIGAAAFVVAVVYHRKLNQFHVLKVAAARHIEVEVLAHQLVYRSAVGRAGVKVRAHKIGSCGRAAADAGWPARCGQARGGACRICSMKAAHGQERSVDATSQFA
jgi:hypothetical protein